MEKILQERKGITLIALVITIIVLLILAGISIAMLAGENGLIAKAQKAKLDTEIAKVEEIAKLRLQAAYIEGLGTVSDETAKTAVMAELATQKYETKDISTSNQTVKGLLIQDSTGKNIDQVSVTQGKTEKIKIALNTEGDTITKTYVKILGKYYEIDITGQDVKVSREAYKEVPDEDKGYQIKLTPPSNGAEMAVGNTKITKETSVVAGAEIVVKGGDKAGTYKFTVKEAKNNIIRDVNVVVKANPDYATDLSLAVKDNGSTTVEAGKKVSIVATKTPSSSTDTVKWSIKSGSATVDDQGNIQINSNAADKSQVVVAANLERKDGTATTVPEKTITLTVTLPASNDDYEVSESEVGSGLGGTAADISAKSNKEIATYFGAPVINYQTDNNLDDGGAGWKIFYIGADPASGEKNIYLILDDCMYVKNTPFPSDHTASEPESGPQHGGSGTEYSCLSGIGYVTSTQQQAYFGVEDRYRYYGEYDNEYYGWKYYGGILTNGKYGKSYIKENSQASGWTNDDYYNYYYRCYASAAYMLDTGIWTNKYKDSDYTKYATGGPTIEMYVASWNKKYPKNKLYCNNGKDCGYYIGTKDTPMSTYADMSGTSGYSDKLYYQYQNQNEVNNTYGYWLASPSASVIEGDNGVMSVSYNGYVRNGTFDHNGFRPLVCLSSNVKLISNGNGTYRLSK